MAIFGIGEMATPQESTSFSNIDAENWSNLDAGSYNMSSAQAFTDAESANLNAHNEAELNRMFQAYMSNTAYQRAVQDLKSAGLNPVMAFYGGGTGATTPQGATGQSFMNSYSSSYSEGGSSEHSTSYGYNKQRSGSESSKGIQNLGKAIETATTDLTRAGFTLGMNVMNGLTSAKEAMFPSKGGGTGKSF